jgi:hypothetical protein
MSEQFYVVKVRDDLRVKIWFQVEEEVSLPVPLEREQWVKVETTEEDVRSALGRLLGWKLAAFRAVMPTESGSVESLYAEAQGGGL